MSTNLSGSPIWTREEDKIFENGIALYGNVDRWENIAVMIPGKSIEEVMEHYQILVEDIKAIEVGDVPLPDYGSSSQPEDVGCEQRKTKSTPDKRRGVPWTKEEHSRFLEGLDKLGRGDWRGIARHFVLTRTAAQVASHAQKFFQRMQPGNHERRRSSIHDVRTVYGCDKSGLIEGESSQLARSMHNMAQMTDIGMDGIPHQRIMPTRWINGIGMHDDKHTDLSSSRPTLLENRLNVMHNTGVGGDRTPVSDWVAQRYGLGGGVKQMPFNAQSTLLTPVDTIDEFGSLIPSTDVDIYFGFCPNYYTSQ